MSKHKRLLKDISKLPADWHGSGSMSPKILEAILDHSEELDFIKFSAETGAGKSTLLFSNLSERHVVFTLDNWGSLTAAKNSSLMKIENVEFVIGPTQKTLPKYNFNSNLDLVLLDGPHGFPFPELEYYYFYPLIRTNGLLLLDDVHIPSINRMLDILKNDDMWDLLEIVDKLAILKRTKAKTIDPFSDSWWLQGYNKALVRKMERREKIKSRLPKSVLGLYRILFKS